MKKLLFAFLAAVLAAVLVSGCTQSYGGNPGGNPPPSGNAVNIQGFAFSPQTITVSVGSTVTWTNLDSATHQIAADPGQPDIADLSSPSINPGGMYSYTFQKAGSWTYHCSIHPSMKGNVIVQ
jgi:plastocyanin